jgi:uncharacterized membrane protein
MATPASTVRNNAGIPSQQGWSLADTAITATLTALAFLGTLIVRVPIPATTGYFNIGDVFVILAGLWLGPRGGLIVGLIGPALADAIGFPQFILATAVTKGLEGFLVGLIGGGPKRFSLGRRITAAIVGGLTMIAGYFVFEAVVYPWLAQMSPFFAVTDLAAAIVEILPNSVQATIGVIGGLALWRAVARGNPHNDIDAP